MSTEDKSVKTSHHRKYCHVFKRIMFDATVQNKFTDSSDSHKNTVIFQARSLVLLEKALPKPFLKLIVK